MLLILEIFLMIGSISLNYIPPVIKEQKLYTLGSNIPVIIEYLESGPHCEIFIELETVCKNIKMLSIGCKEDIQKIDLYKLFTEIYKLSTSSIPVNLKVDGYNFLVNVEEQNNGLLYPIYA